MSAAQAPLRSLRNRSTKKHHADAFWALQDISFVIPQGEVVAIIGRNGAGKSTLLKVLSRVTEPTTGRADIYGRVGSLLEVGTGFHPELTGRENIYLNGAILGMTRGEVSRNFDEIVAFAEIDKFIDTPVKHYSSGMYMRLAFAVAAHLESDLLFIDEVLAVGDLAFQRKCLGKMDTVARQGCTVLLVSHNMAVVRSLCTSGIVLDAGRQIFDGNIGRCIELYSTALQRTSEPADEACSTGFGSIRVNGGVELECFQQDPLGISTELALSNDANGLSLYCMLEDQHGRVVFCLKSESPEFGLRGAISGRLSINVSLPPLWLNPGVYSLYFKAVLWGCESKERCVSDRYPLQVLGTSSVIEAQIHPHADWSVVLR